MVLGRRIERRNTGAQCDSAFLGLHTALSTKTNSKPTEGLDCAKAALVSCYLHTNCSDCSDWAVKRPFLTVALLQYIFVAHAARSTCKLRILFAWTLI